MPDNWRDAACGPNVRPDYEILEEGKAIKFSPCGTVSHNLNDVRNYYCHRCGRYMNSDLWAFQRPKPGMK